MTRLESSASLTGMNLNPIQEAPDSLKREEAAAILRVSVRTVDRLISDGELPAAKIGRAVRVSRADVNALLTPTAPSPAAPQPGEGAFSVGGDAT